MTLGSQHESRFWSACAIHCRRDPRAINRCDRASVRAAPRQSANPLTVAKAIKFQDEGDHRQRGVGMFVAPVASARRLDPSAAAS